MEISCKVSSTEYKSFKKGLPEKITKLFDDKKEFVCSITLQLFKDPVFVDGHNFEREAIENWFRDHQVNPHTNERISSTERCNLKTNFDKISCVGEWKRKVVKKVLSVLPECMIQKKVNMVCEDKKEEKTKKITVVENFNEREHGQGKKKIEYIDSTLENRNEESHTQEKIGNDGFWQTLCIELCERGLELEENNTDLLRVCLRVFPSNSIKQEEYFNKLTAILVRTKQFSKLKRIIIEEMEGGVTKDLLKRLILVKYKMKEDATKIHLELSDLYYKEKKLALSVEELCKINRMNLTIKILKKIISRQIELRKNANLEYIMLLNDKYILGGKIKELYENVLNIKRNKTKIKEMVRVQKELSDCGDKFFEDAKKFADATLEIIETFEGNVDLRREKIELLESILKTKKGDIALIRELYHLYRSLVKKIEFVKKKVVLVTVEKEEEWKDKKELTTKILEVEKGEQEFGGSIFSGENERQVVSPAEAELVDSDDGWSNFDFGAPDKSETSDRQSNSVESLGFSSGYVHPETDEDEERNTFWNTNDRDENGSNEDASDENESFGMGWNYHQDDNDEYDSSSWGFEDSNTENNWEGGFRVNSEERIDEEENAHNDLNNHSFNTAVEERNTILTPESPTEEETTSFTLDSQPTLGLPEGWDKNYIENAKETPETESQRDWVLPSFNVLNLSKKEED